MTNGQICCSHKWTLCSRAAGSSVFSSLFPPLLPVFLFSSVIFLYAKAVLWKSFWRLPRIAVKHSSWCFKENEENCLCCKNFLLHNSRCLKTQDVSFPLKADPTKWVWDRYRRNFLCKRENQTESPGNYLCLFVQEIKMTSVSLRSALKSVQENW